MVRFQAPRVLESCTLNHEIGRAYGGGPTFAPGYQPAGSGAVPAEVFGAAPISTHISLDPKFLEGLGLFNVDTCLPDTLPVADERHVVLHPSFLKDYETDEQDSHVFVKLWQEAPKVLRQAAHTYIIGYSLPGADVAALTLMLTNIHRGSATVVNPSRNVVMRLGRLFRVVRLVKHLRWTNGLPLAVRPKSRDRGLG